MPPTQIKLPSIPSNVHTNIPLVKTADSMNTILHDALNRRTSDEVHVHKQVIKYVKDDSPNNRVAIFTLASRLRMLLEAQRIPHCCWRLSTPRRKSQGSFDFAQDDTAAAFGRVSHLRLQRCDVRC
jgi:hypothetical protein